MVCSLGVQPSLVVLDLARAFRKKEISAWNNAEINDLRKKLTFRAYMWLGTYTVAVVWINLSYVSVYDAVTVRCDIPRAVTAAASV